MQDHPRLSLMLVRRAQRELQATGHNIKCVIHLDSEADARDMPGFVPLLKYQTVEKLAQLLCYPAENILFTPQCEDEIGRCERCFFVASGDQKAQNKAVFTYDDKTVAYDVSPATFP